MLQVRVLIPEKPEMLWEIIMQVLAGEPDFDVSVGPDDNLLPTPANPKSPDVVVLELDNDDIPSTWTHLIDERTRTKVLALKAHGRHAFLYELCPRRVPLGELSPETLVKTIRNITRPKTGG